MIRFALLFTFLLFFRHAFAQSGDLVLFIGQSNMAGRAEIGPDTLTMDKVMLLDWEGAFIPAANPLNVYSTIRKDRNDIQRLSPAFSFCEEVVQRSGDSLFIIVQARGGTAIEKFNKGSDWGYYEATLNRLKRALLAYPGLRLRAVVMHQGESNRANSGTYLDHLHQMVVDMRSDLDDPYLPFLFGEVGPWNPDYGDIRGEMKKIPEKIPRSYLVSSDGLVNQDQHHFDRPSALNLGRRYAAAYWAALGAKED